MAIDSATANIYCIWYPSGGFGHFVNAVLTLHGSNFVRPSKPLTFAPNGNSHLLDLVVPKYYHESWPETFEFDVSKNYSVLIDNGINNESDKFKSVLPKAKVIKICYSDRSWPIIARTSIEKTMNSNLDQELPTDVWNTNESWARREKYFLYLRDHDQRYQWKDDGQEPHTIQLSCLCNYTDMFESLNNIVLVENFKSDWMQWRAANNVYISPVETAQLIIDNVKNKTFQDLSHITDLWTQAVLYYFIYLEFGVEVPHNDYSNWFTNTNDIVKMLSYHGVTVD